MTYDAKRSARLIAELREDDARAAPAPWSPGVWYGTDEGGWAAIGPHHESDPDSHHPDDDDGYAAAKADVDARAIARLRNNAGPAAEQLEAAANEIALMVRLEDVRVMDALRKVAETKVAGELAAMTAERNQYRASFEAVAHRASELAVERDAAYAAGMEVGSDAGLLRLERDQLRAELDQIGGGLRIAQPDWQTDGIALTQRIACLAAERDLYRAVVRGDVEVAGSDPLLEERLASEQVLDRRIAAEDARWRSTRAALALPRQPSGFVPWPAGKPPRYNGSGEPCDMLIGPCSCGATHTDKEWSAEMQGPDR